MIRTMVDMRWETLFEGLESLWAGESDAARFDDERDRVRMSRGATESRDLVWARAAEEHGLAIRTTAGDYRVHPTRVGLDWVDGVVCGSATRIVIPVLALREWSALAPCRCVTMPCQSVPLLEFATVLRFLERKALDVCVYAENRAYNGRITAVWAGAITVHAPGPRDLTFSAIGAITYP